MLSTIYLDYNATTTQLPEVADAVREASLRYGANPGSQHEPGRQARRALEEARETGGNRAKEVRGGPSLVQSRARRAGARIRTDSFSNRAGFGASGPEPRIRHNSAPKWPRIHVLADPIEGFSPVRIPKRFCRRIDLLGKDGIALLNAAWATFNACNYPF